MKTFPLILLVLIAFVARAQESESYYDADWKPIKRKKATYLTHMRKVSDTCWEMDYYNATGPLLKTERYRDKDLKELHGVCRHYNARGYADSSGMYRMGKKNGDFYRAGGDSLHPPIKYVYRDDELVDVINTKAKKRDSVKKYDDEVDSEFPGGPSAWLRYLNHNMRYPEKAIDAGIQGEVRIGFIVGREGDISDLYIAKSVEYSIDEESLRVVRNSGQWTPAFQNGKNVKSYKMQPIIFKLQRR